ncbi:hypothetical protein [Bradyrhizobium sp. Ash2021]|uniref:hypothetical protein n=1 Tax=Bradyrhizobium sp. Ash2021 TaxID=2954771 RepID=UPI002815A690|nr:hypothetical protein [Bradyrhizobium sp. Ash2021]WMT71387.1 hypothetical protein NL528_25175 [Bradyrhizobium sp. Ash2021]
MAKKAKVKKTAGAKKTAKKAAKKRTTFGVSIQKVLEKMKAIVDGNKEQEFLAKCAALGEDRFVTVNSRIVKLVKEFEADHGLRHELPRTATFSPAAAVARNVVAASDDETCFKH